MKKLNTFIKTKLFPTLILLLTPLLLPANGFLQEKKVTIKITNVPLDKAIEQVEEASGLFFLYNSKLINTTQRVSVDKTGAPLAEVLDALLKGTDIKYRLVDGQIVLYSPASQTAPTQSAEAEEELKTAQLVPALEAVVRTPTNQNSQETYTVKGSIVDEAGEPLPFATLALKGTRQTVVSNALGIFEFPNVPLRGATLVASFVGYKTQEVILLGRSSITISLEPDVSLLKDIVVTGYQTIAKERATGSFAIVSSEQIENKLQPTVKSVLEGQAAGVVLTKDGAIEIRGISTFNTSKEPLIVLDGYPLIGENMNLDFINPDNIESITVLKDAVTASIYGSRSANGVIVVTTKSAGKSKGAFNFSYKGTFSTILKPDLNKMNYAGVSDYMDAELEYHGKAPSTNLTLYNGNSKISEYGYLIVAKENPGLGLMSEAEADAKIAELRKINALKQINEHLIQPKQSQQHNFTINSYSETNQFGLMLRYLKENGNVITSGSSRLTADINNVLRPKKWITLRVMTNINYYKSDDPTTNMYSHRVLTQMMTTDRINPYTNLYDNNGNMVPYYPGAQRRLSTYESTPGLKSVLYHPETDIREMRSSANNLQLRLGGELTLQFAEFLQGVVGGTWISGADRNRTIWSEDSWYMRMSYNDAMPRVNATSSALPEGGRIEENRGTMENWVFRSQLNYNQSFKNDLHRVTAMVAFEMMQETNERTYMPVRYGYDPVSASYNSGFNMYDFYNNRANYLFGSVGGYTGLSSLAAISSAQGGNYSVLDKRRVSWMGNASYEFNNKYIVSSSIRWELSNFYGTNPKYRYKPTWSVGGTYKVSNEEYFSNLRTIFDRFHVRATYGLLGSDVLNYAPYLVLTVGTYNATMGGISYGVGSHPNDQLRYEKKNTFNAGIDIALLNNRIDLTLDYYLNKSFDLIAGDEVDPTRGVTSVTINAGELTNTGLEANLYARIVKKRDFGWNSNLIVSYNTSNVDRFFASRNYMSSMTSSRLMVEGYPADSYFGPRYAGLNSNGNVLFYLKDPVVNASGETIYTVNANELDGYGPENAVFQGTYRPPLDLSWTNSFRYKNWEASFMFIGKFGAVYRKQGFDGAYANINHKTVSGRWREPGDEATKLFPKLYAWSVGAISDQWYFPYSDLLIAKANYVKLRDFTLSYNLPHPWMNRFGLSNAKVYFQTRNLFYIASKNADVDPETAPGVSSQGLQMPPEFYFGIVINL